MSNSVQFEDNRVRVINAFNEGILNFLEEASGEIEAQAKRNARFNTSQTKGAWTHSVNNAKFEAVVGNPLENSIWEEFGTGEYAVHGDGRKGGWKYQDIYGKWHFTRGKTPSRALQRAIDSKKSTIGRVLAEKLREQLR
ncbi:HK97 gp10 family phage protein [Thomasclavelia ramosa]|uniref:HK97 gp10 family phage protein n=1 Tax=Thomasclavelia ramosa TaxID=1547 RepID=A0A3E3E9Q7_9FIRM|nr:HK97 gp10 family phage protein [Thomasclavelia ramosa]RGD80347.1 HK97 gp10 family phage protein [Thomasclavelia ramosa]